MSNNQALDPITVLAIHRLAATLPVDEAKAACGSGEFEVNSVVKLDGIVKLGQSYESDNVHVAWMEVAAAALAELAPRQRENFLRRFERSLAGGQSSPPQNARIKGALRRRAIKVQGRRINAGKLTGTLTSNKV